MLRCARKGMGVGGNPVENLDARLRGHDDWISDTHFCGAVPSKDDANANRRTRLLNQFVDEWRDTQCTKLKKTPMLAAIPKSLPRADS
jgi:hypothetical protein